jgi:hypothetical protein
LEIKMYWMMNNDWTRWLRLMADNSFKLDIFISIILFQFKYLNQRSNSPRYSHFLTWKKITHINAFYLSFKVDTFFFSSVVLIMPFKNILWSEMIIRSLINYSEQNIRWKNTNEKFHSKLTSDRSCVYDDILRWYFPHKKYLSFNV